MEIGNKTKLTLTIGSLISIVVFIVSGIIFFLDVKNDCLNRIKDNEYKILSLEKDMQTKASINEIDKLNIKLTNIEALLLELKKDIKEIK